jgi:Right handed beta helix region
MSRLCVFALLWCSLLVGVPGAATAADFHVATSGNDSNSCSAAAPCRTVRRGSNALSGGDTLIVHAGLYSEGDIRLPSGSEGHPTTIKAQPGDTVTLRPNNRNVDQVISLGSGQSYITIDGLVLDAGSPSGERLSFGVVVNQDHDSPSGHHFTVQNCEIKNGRQQGLHIAGGQWLVKNNHIHHNGVDAELHHGVYFSGHDSLIVGNTMDNNKCTGLQNYSSAGANTSNNTYRNNILTQNGCGLIVAQGSGHTIINNLIYEDGTGQRNPAALTCCGPNTKVYHNTIVNNAIPGLASYGSGASSNVDIRNNIVCSNRGGQISVPGATLSGNMTSCPTFITLAGAAYHLAPGSAAIDAVPCLPAAPADAGGGARPQGGQCDTGAYEFGSSGPIDPPVVRPAIDIYVAGTGSDATPCDTVDVAHPRQTLAGGLACLSGGKTLYLRAGAYAPLDSRLTPIPSGESWATATTIQAYNGETVTLTATTSQARPAALFLHNAERYLILAGLILDGANLGNAVIMENGVQSVRIQESELRNAKWEVLYIRDAAQVEVLTSHIHTNAPGPALIGLDGAVTGFVLEGSTLTDSPNAAYDEWRAGAVTKSRLTRNTIQGVGTGSGMAAVRLKGAESVVINTLVTGARVGIHLAPSATKTQVMNTTLAMNTGTGLQIEAGAMATTVTNVLAYGNGANLVDSGTSTILTGTSNVVVDPHFVDPAQGNFHLPATSPACGVGVTLPAVPIDLDGLPRTAPYSAGAYVCPVSVDPPALVLKAPAGLSITPE